MSLARFLRSLRSTRKSQLAGRLRRIAGRCLHDLAPRLAARRAASPTPAARVQWPQPIFAPRARLACVRDGATYASLLGRTYPLRAPVDWQFAEGSELERMHLHYMEYLEALDDGQFARVVTEWVAANPLGRRAAWRIAWNSYVVSLRAVVWMQQLAVRRARLEPSFVHRTLDALAEQLRFLERHLELDIGGNHVVKNAKALLWGASVFDGPDAERWSALALRLLRAAVAEQVLPDGAHYERSPAYHLQVLADLIECAHAGGAELAAELRPTLAAMAQFAVDTAHPDGAPSLFNDGGLSMAYSPEQCCAAYERVTGAQQPRARDVFAFQHAGYFGARHGASLFLADCGALAPDHLPAHGHGDALSFEWSAGGRRIVVDAGTYEYERGLVRDLARSTRVHNTVTLDDQDQAEFWAAFRVGRRPRVCMERYELLGRGFIVDGSHDGYAHLDGDPIHRRRFVVGRDSFVIDDSVDGGARQSVAARLLLHPDVQVRLNGKHMATLRAGDVAVVVESRHPMTVIDAEWFPDFGVRCACKQIVVHYAPAPCRGSFRLQRVELPAQAQLLETRFDPLSARAQG